MNSEATSWQSLGHLLHEQASRFGNRTLFRFEGTDMTFAQAEEETNRLAHVLLAHGIGKGVHVAVLLPNSLDFPLAWLAIAKAGAVMVPVNTQYQEHDLSYILSDSEAQLVLTDAAHASLLQQVRPACPRLRAIGIFAEADSILAGTFDVRQEMAAASAAYPDVQVDPADLLNVQYTSGTTGFPKGCMLTHEYWLLLGQLVAEYLALREDDVNLTAQPFYYMDPQWNVALCLLAGIPLVILPRFSASTFWKAIKENEVSFFYLLGTMPMYLLKQPENPELEQRHRLRVVLCSGIVPQLHALYEQRWNVPWREAYGTTESGADLFVPLDDAESVGSGAMGKPVRTKEARVIDPQVQELADGEIGELVVCGKPMMQGYYHKPDATAEKLRDGWLHSGDLVFRDAKGYYHLVGRLKDMIRRSGENIAASEVEAVLCEHPQVRAAAVVPEPDDLRGEEVRAFIQLQPGETPASAPPQTLIDFTRGKLAAFKVPRFITYVESFPLTPSERIAKHKLLESSREDHQPTYDALSQTWR
ncbi:MAG TPA: AMP-binding protein [Ktedonobacterales bacterium]|jgi:crotonobetaine/carnitine-CoA ligase